MRIIFVGVALGLAFIFFDSVKNSAAASDSGHTVIIGDSHSCGQFGATLVNQLSHKGQSVELYCASSSTPEHWLSRKNPKNGLCKTLASGHLHFSLCDGDGKMPDLNEVFSKAHGGRVILALGTNSLLSPTADHKYRALAQRAAAHAKCDWIGPPHMNLEQVKGFDPKRIAREEKNLDAFYDSLGEVTQTLCHLVDSRDATHKHGAGNQTVDGVHRTDKAADYWVDQIRGPLIGGGSGSEGTSTGVGAGTASAGSSH